MSEERVKRKLSAILSADVVGYSCLMGEDTENDSSSQHYNALINIL